MSGTMSSCCPSVVTDVFVCPPQPCQFAPLNCLEPTSIVIQTILDLREPQGSSAQDIFQRASAVCPSTPLTLTDVENVLNAGAKRGVFRRIIPTVGATPTYMILARMALFNYQNRRLNRFPCMFGSFWACGNR